jgi:dipeptidyl aminopeptidase/acylaminoacyl peptidase
MGVAAAGAGTGTTRMRSQNRVGARRVSFAAVALFTLVTGAVSGVAWAQPAALTPAAPAAPKLIPRAALFGNPEKAGAQISPDGGKLAYLAPLNGVLNVWVGPSGKVTEAKAVTADTGRGIRQYFWAHTGQHVIYLQDTNGDENWRAYCVDLATGKTLPLTPMDKVAVQVEAVSEKFPEEVVLGINDRDPALHDLYRVNIRTGERTLMLQNDQEFAGFSVDDEFKVRFAQKMVENGDVEEFKAVEKDGKLAFESYDKIPREDSEGTGGIGFDKTGMVRYVRDTRGRDTSAVFAVDLNTGTKKLVFEHDKVDAGGVMIHPTEKTIQAVEYDYDKPRWGIIDRVLEKDWQFIRKNAGDGTLVVASRSLDDRIWIVGLAPDTASSRTYLYDRGAQAPGGSGEQKITQLYVTRPALQGYKLAPMLPVEIATRDGLTMMCYLTIPLEADANGDKKADRPMPLVVNVHGGPWARDNWGFDSEHQWLANRGYAVLSVNYRGSTGFGKKFLNASERQWGGRMHEDLIDAVNWAVAQKIADPAKVAIYGGSYGGYAALAGLTFTPDVFACGVDIVGVSNLTTFMKTIPPYWKPFLEYMYKMVGDPRTEEGKAFLLDRSPVTHVDKIKKPLLIAQGAMDPRVNKDESDQIVKAMSQKNIPVTYVVYPDEGHGFARPQNRQSFYAVAEAFLAKHLGGRAEPVGSDFEGSSISIENGAEQVPGIAEAVGGKK